MSNALKIVLLILLDADEIGGIIANALYIVGLWKLLTKSGLKGWLALIPWVREYEISRCAKREPEGRVYCLLSFLMTALNVYAVVGQRTILARSPTSIAGMASTVLAVAFALVSYVYGARLFAGLIEIYGKKKIWILLWFLPETRFIPALLWGFGKKYQPTM